MAYVDMKQKPKAVEPHRSVRCKHGMKPGEHVPGAVHPVHDDVRRCKLCGKWYSLK